MRTLSDKGGPMLPEDQMKAYTKAYPINDELANPQLFDKDTEEFRALKPTDNFPAVENQGAPDLSLMAKARSGFHGPYGLGINQFVKGIGGAEYIASILTGLHWRGKRRGWYNVLREHCLPWWLDRYGIRLSMAKMSSLLMVTPTICTTKQKTVAAFLRWTAEPHQDARKRTGFVAVLLMVFLTVMLYLTNKLFAKKSSDKLEKLIEPITDEQANLNDEDSTSISNVIAHRAHWITLFLGWYTDGMAGKQVYFPAEGYKWNDLKRYNADLRKKQTGLSWTSARNDLRQNYNALTSFIENHTDAELYGGPMKGANNQWTPGRWAEAAGPSHFRSAAKYIRARLKSLKST
ncbi:Cytochrome c1 [Nymphon striatum]|nr:Cytochrome c1 [Nymphon striatum]